MKIRAAEGELVARFAFLAHRDALALGISLGAAGAMAASTLAYGLGWLPALSVLLLNAVLASVLHEIEHDLIHRIYFGSTKWLYDGVMGLVWLCKANGVHGWYRRTMHLVHHRSSGSRLDLEERLLGLGMPWGSRRLLATLDGGVSYFLLAPRLSREIPGFRRRDLFWAAAPVYPLFVAVLLAYPLAAGVWPGWLETAGIATVLRAAFFGWAAPNVLRQFALTTVSSNIHYYGEDLALNRQAQIWRRWYLCPLQCLCFNFGATHVIHHFVVEQPFFIRQAIAGRVLPSLRAAGVSSNDLATVVRANRSSE